MPTPSGRMLGDGFPTLATFALSSSIALWLKTIKPAGADSGGPIDVTTMHNTRFRTMLPKQLITATAITGTCAYDPKVLNDIYSIIGKNQLITTRFPDYSQWAHYGYLDKFEPNEVREGEQPTATYTIQPTNLDGNQNEAAPIYTTGTSTTTTTNTTTTTTTP